ncbi:hypothetical protein J6590_054289 [Homalodisca vitripennis]|nr:hypothetical protein J6590_054286 [Homalodisca vitripennis]KAG8306159.1 hypothetical protein J6590_054289 [Homalodisca vitripennis]
MNLLQQDRILKDVSFLQYPSLTCVSRMQTSFSLHFQVEGSDRDEAFSVAGEILGEEVVVTSSHLAGPAYHTGPALQHTGPASHQTAPISHQDDYVRNHHKLDENGNSQTHQYVKGVAFEATKRVSISFMMDSDDDDVFILWWWLKKQKRRKYWVHPLIRDRQHSTYVVARHLCSDPVKFKDFFRMSKPLFDRLVELVSPLITRKDTNWRLVLSVEEKLTIAVR